MTEGAKLYSAPVDGITIRAEDMSDAPGRWDSYVMSHPYGTVFHTESWQRLIQSSFGHRPLHLVAETHEGAISGICPLFLVHSGIFGRMLISTPQAAYGGILADNPSVTQSLYEKAQGLARDNNVQFLELRNRTALQEPSLAQKDMYVTFRLELSGEPNEHFAAIPRKTRAECRAGINNGLEFKENAIGIREFYRVYSHSVRNLGTPVFSRRLFANGLREFGRDCRIFSVHWKGKPVAAVWTLFYKNEIVPYYGGSIREYKSLAPNNFMYWMLIRYGCENGYRVFDFGRSKKGTGSFDFKKRWGMAMTDLPYQYYLVRKRSLPDTSPMNPKFSLGVRLWRKLPLPVANTVGPFIARHLI